MLPFIDLRSDTVTLPTHDMKRAMMDAPLGDDVYGEDPTIRALEEKASRLFQREAALFVPSGTMANQIAIKTLTQPGEEVIVEAGAHPFMFEAAGAAVISGVQLRPLPGDRGILDPAQVEEAIRPTTDVHHPASRLICLENTSNRGGGSIYPLKTIQSIRHIAERHDIPIHLDGARIFNAVVATGIAPHEYATYCETLSFCLSKGLGAPVGSVLVGDRATIARARKWRKMLGGGMRQAGILAAAGVYALDHHVERLAEDHENARILAKGLGQIPGLDLNPDHVETNIVIFRISQPGLSGQVLTDRLKERGILVGSIGGGLIRAVTHLGISTADIDRAINAFVDAMAA